MMRKPAKVLDEGQASAAEAWSARRLVSAIKSQWQRGEPADARGVLAQYPQLGSDKSAVLDLAYEEYCLREQAGASPDPDEFCERFPPYKTSLRRLIAAHHCMGAVAPADDVLVSWPEEGDSFLGFALRHELGRGAFARVFLANDTELGGKWVVVKVARHGAAEAELLGRLDGHPNVVPVLSIKREELSGWTAVCMPYLGGATLCDVIDAAFAGPALPRDARVILEAAQRPCPADVPVPGAPPHRLLRRGTYIDGVLHLAGQLADGLSFVHARGICHGDLKPSNILLTPDGRPMLVDFNLASDPRRSGQRLGGTLPYMAPEQLEPGAWEQANTPLDRRSDLFALGVILYELLTGEHPFGPIPVRGAFAEIRTQLLESQRRGARPVRQLNPHVPRRLARVVGQCLAFAPEDRPQSAEQVALELRRELRRPRVLGRWAARHRRLVLELPLAVILLLSGATAWVYGPGLWQDYQQRRQLAEARELMQKGDNTAAIERFTRLMAQHPADPRLALLRAKAYFRQGRSDAMVEDLIRAAPADRDGRLNAFLGFLLQTGHQSKEAIPYYMTAIDKGFGPAEVHNNLGFCYRRAGRLEEARACFDRAARLNPDLQAAYYNRALVVLLRLAGGTQQDPNPDAIRDMDRALKLGPRTGTLYQSAAQLQALAAESDLPGSRERVLFHVGKAIELGIDPKKIEADDLFRSLRGDPDFRRVLRTAPGRPPPAPEPDLHLADLRYLSGIIFAD